MSFLGTNRDSRASSAPLLLGSLLAALMGMAVATQAVDARSLVGIMLLVGFGLAASRRISGCAVTLMAIGACNGLPFLGLPGGIRAGLLPGILAVVLGSALRWGVRLPRLWPLVAGWSGFMLCLLILGWLGVWFDFGSLGPLSRSVEQSADVAALAILPLPLILLLGDVRVWRWALVVFAGVLLVRATLRLGLFIVGDPASLVQTVLNPYVARSVNGMTMAGQLTGPARLVSNADSNLPWLWSVCLGYFLLGPVRHRAYTGVALVVVLACIALTYTRALYLGVLASVLWVVANSVLNLGGGSRPLRRAPGRTLPVAAVLLGAVLVTAIGSVRDRATSLFSDSTGTGGYRADLADRLWAKLHGPFDHLFGLGFVSPVDRYDPNVWWGTTWNPDVGLLSVVITTGIVGGLAFVLAIGWLFYASLRALRGISSSRVQADPLVASSLLGSTILGVFILAVSPTLFLGFGNGPGFALQMVLAFLAISFAHSGTPVVRSNGSAGHRPDSERRLIGRAGTALR